MPSYRTRPLASTQMPTGIPYIVGNEAAERFSFYGMRAILVVFMTQHLVDAAGKLDVMSEAEAKGWYHLFVSAVYFTPVLGALVSDALLGKYRSIIALSIVYCLGHFVLALDDTRVGLAMGLGLIVVNWLLMLRSKAILRAIGTVPLQLFGAVFGVLQLALALQFIHDAIAMM